MARQAFEGLASLTELQAPRGDLARRWYLISFVREVVPIFSVYALMMQAHGEGPMQISALLIVWSVAAFVFEVPTGTLGDRFPRRNVLAASRFVQALAFVVWLAFPSFWGYAVGFALWGLAGSLWSGTNEALLYESLSERGEQHRFDEV